MSVMIVDKVRSRLDRALRRAAQTVSPSPPPSAQEQTQQGFGPETLELWEQVRSRTMTSLPRIDALRMAVEYIEGNSIPGDVVECGVWRGGSMMAACLTLRRLRAERQLWLYDTFAGMPPPGSDDKDFNGRAAADLMAEQSPDTSHIWARSTLDDVKIGMGETRYPTELVKYIVGPVESTIPDQAPERIALLRLDTDWYSSTYHELVHLWPRISPNGVLIIDDYGYWAGAKRAVDQYFHEIRVHPFLHRIDDTGRAVIKCNDR
jgi:O-methyltransferase